MACALYVWQLKQWKVIECGLITVRDVSESTDSAGEAMHVGPNFSLRDSPRLQLLLHTSATKYIPEEKRGPMIKINNLLLVGIGVAIIISNYQYL